MVSQYTMNAHAKRHISKMQMRCLHKQRNCWRDNYALLHPAPHPRNTCNWRDDAGVQFGDFGYVFELKIMEKEKYDLIGVGLLVGLILGAILGVAILQKDLESKDNLKSQRGLAEYLVSEKIGMGSYGYGSWIYKDNADIYFANLTSSEYSSGILCRTKKVFDKSCCIEVTFAKDRHIQSIVNQRPAGCYHNFQLEYEFQNVELR